MDNLIKQLREAGKFLEETLILDWFVQLTNAIRYIHDRSVKRTSQYGVVKEFEQQTERDSERTE